MQIVSDPTANRPEQLEDAVNTIGRSKHKLDVFKAIYRGQKQMKSVSEIEKITGLPKRRVLDAGKALADGNVVQQTRDTKGETAYAKLRAISFIRDKIISGVAKPEKIAAMATKRRPPDANAQKLFKTNSRTVRKTRSLKATSAQHRIAMLTASPIGEDPIDVSLEAREIENERQKSAARDKFDVRLFPAATTESLLTAINDYQPEIYHFSGHGSSAGLSFDNSTIKDVGGTHVQFPILRKLMMTAPQRPKLIFLNACESFGGSTDLTEVADVIISMSDSVTDSTAFHYSRRFYASLFSGLSIATAHDQAKAILEIDDASGALLPKITCAEGIDAAKISFS
ncbi:CHAT domain-containing protein [Altererythrobacter sp. CAU 1778]